MADIADLVHETTTTTGTGDLTVAATGDGKQRFSGAFGTGSTQDVFEYFVSHRTAAEWERGTGHMSDANTLVRDTVDDNSNGDTSPVNFSAGAKDVTCDVPASKRLAALTPTKGRIVVGDGSEWKPVGVGSDDQVLTADSAEASGVKWADDSGDLGDGKSYTDVTSNRSSDTQYTNNTGGTIFVIVSLKGSNEDPVPAIKIDGVTRGQIKHKSSSNSERSTQSFAVPDGDTYEVEAGDLTIIEWHELK